MAGLNSSVTQLGIAYTRQCLYSSDHRHYNRNSYICICLLLNPGIHVGYTQSVYSVNEREGHIQLCAIVKQAQSGVSRPFNLEVFTSNGTAG